MDEWMYNGWNEWMDGWIWPKIYFWTRLACSAILNFSPYFHSLQSFLFCIYVTLGIMVSTTSKVQAVNKVLSPIWSLRSSFDYLVKVWKPPTWTRTLKQSLAFPKLKTLNGVSHAQSTCRPRRIRYACVSKGNIVNLFNVWKQVWHHMLN